MGRLFTPKERRTYQNICHLTERGVLAMMADFLRSKYKDVIATPNYVIALGDIDVGLVAHADTVFSKPPSIDNFFYDTEKNVIWNPDGMGADDRAGVFAILTILRTTDLRPHVIISTGEECGCIGSGKLISKYRNFLAPLNFMIQLDRRGKKDSVYYDCTNDEFEEYINSFGFETEWGSFTDISVLAPCWGCAAVNFSIGYEDEHHEIERLFVDAMFDTIEKTISILRDQRKNPKFFQYIEAPYAYYWRDDGALESYTQHCKRAYATAWDNDDDWDPPSGYGKCTFCQTIEKEENMIPIYFKYGKTAYHTCINCFGKHSNSIVFCHNCGKGFYLGLNDLKNIPDPSNYICEDCKNGKHVEGTPASGGQSVDVQSESAASADRRTTINLAKKQGILY